MDKLEHAIRQLYRGDDRDFIEHMNIKSEDFENRYVFKDDFCDNFKTIFSNYLDSNNEHTFLKIVPVLIVNWYEIGRSLFEEWLMIR